MKWASTIFELLGAASMLFAAVYAWFEPAPTVVVSAAFVLCAMFLLEKAIEAAGRALS